MEAFVHLVEFEKIANMSQKMVQDKAFDIDGFSESKFLTPYQRQLLLKNLQANLQPKCRRRVEIMLLADVGSIPNPNL